MTRFLSLIAVCFFAPTTFSATEGLRSEFPASYRVHDPKSYIALAALYHNAKTPAKPSDFAAVSLSDNEKTLNENHIKCAAVGMLSEKPSQPFSVLYAYNVTFDPKQDGRNERLGTLIQAPNQDFLFFGKMSDGAPFSVANANVLRDAMGQTEAQEKDLVIHAEKLPGYYNSPVNIYLRKNGDFISFCLRRNDSGDDKPCEADNQSRPLFSHDSLTVYGYCFPPNSDPKTAVGDLTKAPAELHLSGAGDEAAFRNVIGRFGNNYYHGRARGLTDETLDIDARVDYSLASNDTGPIRFLIADNGDCRHAGDRLYPIAGLAQFKVTQPDTAEPRLTRFYDSDLKSVVTFDTRKFKFYVIESDASFAKRLQRSKSTGQGQPQGKMLMIVDWSFSHQDIRFYEMAPSSDDAYDFSLKFSGTYKGDSRDFNWGWNWGRGWGGGSSRGGSGHCNG